MVSQNTFYMYILLLTCSILFKQDYLTIPLSPEHELSDADIQQYSDYSAKFLHVFVCKLDDIEDLPSALDVMRECYKVSKLGKEIKSAKDAVFAENLLYHLITKLIKKVMVFMSQNLACNFSSQILFPISTIYLL